MTLGRKQDRTFIDPPLEGECDVYTIRSDLSVEEILTLKFHFFYPITSAVFIGIFLIMFWMPIDHANFGRTDQLLYLTNSMLIIGGFLLALRLTDFSAVSRIFRKKENEK